MDDRASKLNSVNKYKLSQEFLETLRENAEILFRDNPDKFKDATPEQIFVLGYIRGFEACFNAYDLGDDV